jgi:glutamate decarboxylase
MLAELFHAPGETTGTSTQGSSEAIMLGALSLKWKWRQVRSINASGHKFGLVYPGVGWLIFREKSDLAEDLVFFENYLGKTDATFTLNFSTGSSMALAQYYNFVRFGKAGYRRIMEIMQENAQSLAKDIEAIGKFQIVGAGEETLPLVAFNLAEEHPYDEFDIAFQLAAERGWMIPAYTMPPNAHDVKMMRALVKLNLSRSLVNKLDDDIAEAIKTLEEKGPVSESERKLVKTSVTH